VRQKVICITKVWEPLLAHVQRSMPQTAKNSLVAFAVVPSSSADSTAVSGQVSLSGLDLFDMVDCLRDGGREEDRRRIGTGEPDGCANTKSTKNIINLAS